MPILARVYHVPPDRQHKLTRKQFRVLQADYQQLQQAEGVT